MILKELEKIVVEERAGGMRQDFIRNVLKEYLQVYILSFVYTHPEYGKKLIFTGGTCLKHFYNLERLSEDVDFDYAGKLSTDKLTDDALDFFGRKYKYTAVRASLKQEGRQILLKFPVLKALGMPYPGGSDWLYVKMDVSPVPSKNYAVIASSQSKYGFNYVAKHYDLPDLMAGKIHAILTRRMLKGSEQRESIKGRDYFDLLWFLKKKIRPNFERLSDMLGKRISAEEIKKELDKKVKNLDRFLNDYTADIEPLVKNPESVKIYIHNYMEEYRRNPLEMPL